MCATWPIGNMANKSRGKNFKPKKIQKNLNFW